MVSRQKELRGIRRDEDELRKTSKERERWPFVSFRTFPIRSINWDLKGIRVIEVIDFKSEVRFVLRGHLKDATASEI